MLYTGCVENRDDPLKLGRCQVRIVGLHTDDKIELPTEDLPWAFPMQPVTSAAINGIGWTPTGPVPGSWVVLLFRDDDMQQPIMIGTIGGIPQSKASERIIDNSDTVATDGGIVMNSLGKSLKDASGEDVGIAQGIQGMMKGNLEEVANNLAAAVGNLFGINLGGKNAKAEELQLPVTGAADESKPTIVPKVQSGADAKITAQPVPGKADDKILNTSINIDPPAKYAPKDVGKAKQCISAIISACDKVGLTSKYAKCSILGICGGESQWLPIEEGYSYTADSLLKVFPGVFKGDTAKAEQYGRWKGSRADFFREIYSPKYRNGQGAGNKLPDDGALFYGRGFNQITGRALYEQLERELKKIGVEAPISKQPDLLITDVTISALATVMFYKLNVKHSQDDPGYFQAALKRTGNPVGDSYTKKQVMYEYFLGQGVISSSTNKPSADQDVTYSKDEVAHLPQNKQLALLEDRSSATTIGFQDPKGKYPLRNLLDEPDTNRLARGIIKETSMEFKDQSRTTGVETANEGSAWEQPLAPFGGQYPYSKVYESEAGHLSVWDDTPGNETLSTYHRSGTFTDVDANGTQVNKIIGDGYTVIDRNGLIYIAGRCNLTVGNSVSIYVMGNADIEVNGVTTANLHGDLNLGCARDVNWAVGGDLNLKVDGDFNTAIGGNATKVVTGNNDYNVTGNTTKVVTGNATTKVTGSMATLSTAAQQYESGANISLKAGADMYSTAGGAQHILASANVNVHGSEFHGQEGSAAAAAALELKIAEVVPLELVAPELRAAASDSYELLQTPVRASPPVDVKSDLTSASDAALADFKSNPNKYYDANAEEGGVNPQRPPQPDVGDAGQSLKSGAVAGDIASFLQKQIALAKECYWSETGMSGGKSNPNILAIWKDIGLGSIGSSDQVAWCAAFVNWTLKQCNYRYFQSARAFDFRDKPDKWKITKVSTPQPGDICIWTYSHINFVYTVDAAGKCTFVGGNQGGGKVTDNNPKGGSVTISYPNGVQSSHPNIVGFYRPSKD